MKLSVIIPCYNEKNTIREIVDRVNAVPVDTQIIVVDDGSTDGSAEIITGEISALVDKTIVHDKNQGKGAAVRTGLAAATGDLVIVQDADLELDPQEYPTLMGPLINGEADVVYGSRFMVARPHRVDHYRHYLGNRAITIFSNLFTNLNLSDMETCYKMFRSDVLKQIELEEKGFGFDPEVTAKIARHGFRVYEVGINYTGRSYMEGKKLDWKTGMRVAWCIVKYGGAKRPAPPVGLEEDMPPGELGRTRKRRYLSESKMGAVFPFLAGVIGFAAMLWLTRWGTGIEPDSVLYITDARDLLAGKGYAGSPTYGPLFPVLLYLIGLLGIDPLDGARYLNALLYAGTIVLVGMSLRRLTGSFAVTALGSALALLAIPLADTYSWAMTEPVFIFLGLLGLYWLSVFVDPTMAPAEARPPPPVANDGGEKGIKLGYWLLVLSALAIGLAFLSRYTGIVLVATGLFILLFTYNVALRRRIVDAGVFLALSCLPVVLWSVRNAVVHGSATNREILFHPVTVQKVNGGLVTLATWMIPGIQGGGVSLNTIATGLLVITMAAVLFLAAIVASRKQPFPVQRPHVLALILAVFSVGYLSFLLLSISFFDASTPLDQRILTPLFPALLILLLYLGTILRRSGRASLIFRATSLTLVLLIGLLYLGHGVGWLLDTGQNGRGFAHTRFTESPTLSAVSRLPEEAVVYSNGADVIEVLTGREAERVPVKVDPATERRNPRYLDELREMNARLNRGPGAVVFFDNIDWRWYLVDGNELAETTNLRVRERLPDGTVYAPSSP